MTDALKKAAEEASEALGLGVEAIAASDESIALVEVYTPIDGPSAGMPVVEKEFGQNTAAALAYLEGLSQGAHIATVRYEALVEICRIYTTVPGSDPQTTADLLREALAELGTTTQAREES